MKSTSPHDPLDDLIAAALHGELTPEERKQLETRLQNDPAARAAYQETQAMHDLLEKTHREVQPDPNFEQRMISGVRRKLQHEQQHRETAWESVLVLWRSANGFLRRRRWWEYGVACVLLLVALFNFSVSNRVQSTFSTISSELRQAQVRQDYSLADATSAVPPSPPQEESADMYVYEDRIDAKHADDDAVRQPKAALQSEARANIRNAHRKVGVASGNGVDGVTYSDKKDSSDLASDAIDANGLKRGADLLVSATQAPTATAAAPSSKPVELKWNEQGKLGREVLATSGNLGIANSDAPAPKPAETPDTDPNRKLIRNAELELEVKSFQAAMDQITTLTKAAGGYIDTNSSQRGGNGKLQGVVVAKVLPQNLDDFLLKLRDLGQIKNQTLKSDDVTKAYFDTQARLANSRRMEAQLQELLKRENGKVSELLQVERELGRVRGEIEQMQGELKLYDFQVRYATVTMQVREKDLNQAAAYLLKEKDNFSLYATNVEETFRQARKAAEEIKGQILLADLHHHSGSNVTAELDVMVAPDDIETFLAQIRMLGRIDNFTRQTQRVARDGGDSDQPADETLTERDKVQVHLSIRSDDESRKQVALTVVTSAVDEALEKAKAAALASTGVEILDSSLNKMPQGQSTGQLRVRVPGTNYPALLESFRALGRTASFSLQRNDNSGPGKSGDEAPVIVSLALTDNETPIQRTDMSVLASSVDEKAQQIKKDAAAIGIELKASNFQRQPDGIELAQLTFQLPMSKYPTFVESLKKLGKVESLTVRREDRPDQMRTEETAPAEIRLSLHSQGNLVTDDNGLWTTLRRTFGEGMAALFGSIKTIGVLAAFLAPWLFVLVLAAWVGRRIYIRRRK